MKFNLYLLGASGKLEETNGRNVSIIQFSFPNGLIGYSNIHSSNQLNGLLNFFGRGIVDDKGNVRIGNIGTSHVGLAKGLENTKRFYFGFNRSKETVYVLSKNSVDSEYIQKPTILKLILSDIFDMFKLSISPNKKLKFIEIAGRPKVPGKILLRRLSSIDDIKKFTKKKPKRLNKHKRSTK